MPPHCLKKKAVSKLNSVNPARSCLRKVDRLRASAGDHSERVVGGSRVGLVLAGACFAVVAAGISWGIYFIVAGLITSLTGALSGRQATNRRGPAPPGTILARMSE